MQTRRCILTLSPRKTVLPENQRFVRDLGGAARNLAHSLAWNGFDGDFLSWDNEYPSDCPTHETNPYAFRPFCFLAAAQDSYDSLLWIDPTLLVRQCLNELFQIIENRGYVIFADDRSVDTLGASLSPAQDDIAVSRARPSLCCPMVLGLDLRRHSSRDFLEAWRRLALQLPLRPHPEETAHLALTRVGAIPKDNRHGQAAVSAAALGMNLDQWLPRNTFSRFFEDGERVIPSVSANPRHGAKSLQSDPDPGHDIRPQLRIVFMCFGRGRGWASPCVAIAEELKVLNRNFDLQLVSYGNASDLIRDHGWPVIELGGPDTQPFVPTLIALHRVIAQLRPDFVVSLGEWAAIPAARMLGIRSIFATDWFPSAKQASGQCIPLADSIIFLGPPERCVPTTATRHPPISVGPVIRKMTYGRNDRLRARRELGLPSDAWVVSAVPGAWISDQTAPIAEKILSTFRQLPFTDKFLFYLTKPDYLALCDLTRDDSNVRVIQDCANVEQILVSSDVVVTRGNRGTIMEAASLGICTFSLSFGANTPDEIIVPSVRSNRSFNAREVTPPMLCAEMEQLAKIPYEQRAEPLGLHSIGGARAAKAIVGEIHRLLQLPAISAE